MRSVHDASPYFLNDQAVSAGEPEGRRAMLCAPSRTRPAHVVEFRAVGTENRVSHILNDVGGLSQEMADARDGRDRRSVLPIRGALMARRWRRGRSVNDHSGHLFFGSWRVKSWVVRTCSACDAVASTDPHDPCG